MFGRCESKLWGIKVSSVAKAYLSAKKQRTDELVVKPPPGLTEGEKEDEPKFILKTVFTRGEESSASSESPSVKMIKEKGTQGSQGSSSSRGTGTQET